METVQGYVILKAATFETGHGFALGHNPGAPSPFVTWQFTEGENGHRDYYWGRYGTSQAWAQRDFDRRVDDYQQFYHAAVKHMVLDVMMPGMDGFETLEEIRKENSLPILMFTSKNDSISKVRGLRAGADDYLTKPFDMDELIARIASLIRRYTRFNQQAGAVQKLDFDGLQIDLENRSVTTANGTFELPPKEFELLLYCAKHQGKILTKQQIYEEVWGEEYFYDDSNIMAIISRLRKKLEVNPSSPKYIQTVKGIGYRFNKEV